MNNENIISYIKKIMTLAGIVLAFSATPSHATGVLCVSNVRIKYVTQGDQAWGESKLVGIIVVDNDGKETKFYTYRFAEVGSNPEARTLLTMALAAQSSQMPVNVYAKEDCTEESLGWIDAWNGLGIWSAQ